MKRKPKPEPPAPIIWPRADPQALAKFDPRTKRCTMNCGQVMGDPRSREECKFLCGDCLEIDMPERKMIHIVRGTTGEYREDIREWDVAAFLDPALAAEFCEKLNAKTKELGMDKGRVDDETALAQMQALDPQAKNWWDGIEFKIATCPLREET